MIKNYFKIAWRNLIKSKVFSLIHILGLTIGITVCMMIFLFISNEFSMDNFHTKGKSMYRLMRRYDALKAAVPFVSPPYATALLNDFPDEIKQAVRVMPSNGLVSFNDKAFREKKIYIADDGFFTMFSFPLLKGDPKTALKEPGSIVLTESTAKKYFGNQDPIGKVVLFEKHKQLKVTGVAKDVPSNSHLEFDAVIPLSNYMQEDSFKGWMNNNLFTYLLLNDGVSKEQLEKNLPHFMDKYMGADMAHSGAKFSLSLTPLSGIYFETTAEEFDFVKHGDKTMVYIFISIGVLILLIACINFMNLSTVRAVERSKEVGLRKVLGAMRNHLIWQFIGESILLTLISCVFSILLLMLLLPMYNSLLGYSLTVSWSTWQIYLFLASIIVLVGFLAGSYPAFFLSAFSPVEALKGKLRLGKSGSFFRQFLVVIQFSISVLLIISTLVILNQMNYVKSKALGYDKAQAIIVKMDNDDIYKNRKTFINELTANSNVLSVSLMSGEPGGYFDIHTFYVENKPDVWRSRTEFADFNYVKTLGLKVIAGRDFSAQFKTDTTSSVLINRTAATKLGYTPEQALGKKLSDKMHDSTKRSIIGVVEDFNFMTLKENMDALVISPAEDWRVAIIKLKPGNISSGLESVKNVYNKAAPVYPFEYTFLDQKFDMIYKTDIRQQKILTIFSGLAIFIACLGLFGLTSFTAKKRTKEIGVRKVLGSSVQNILLILSKDLLKPVFIATFIAIPIGYFCMDKWLQNFAYRTTLHWWIFVLSALIIFTIALATVSFQAIKAALANPVKSLRSE